MESQSNLKLSQGSIQEASLEDDERAKQVDEMIRNRSKEFMIEPHIHTGSQETSHATIPVLKPLKRDESH